MNLLVISPHLDDAVFSCGQLLAAHPGATIVTVCTGDPDAVLTAYDQSCGFDSSADAAAARRGEDHRAATILAAASVHLGHRDGQYAPLDSTEITEDLLRLFRSLDDREATTVLAPVGLHHPDHLLVSDAALTALGPRARIPGPVWLYEELPYRVVDPDEVEHRLDVIEGHGWRIEQPDPPKVGDLWLKEAARACYRSQRPEWEHALYVPERFHAVTWDPRGPALGPATSDEGDRDGGTEADADGCTPETETDERP